MKKTKIISIKQFNIIEFIKKNKISLLLCVLFLIGAIVSVVLYKRTFISNKIPFWLNDYYFSIKQATPFISFSKSFLSLLLIIVTFYMCGTSMMGIITVPISVSLLGFITGSFIAHIYSQYAIKGVAYTAVILVPSALIFLVALLNTCKYTISFSFNLLKLTFGNNSHKNIADEFKNYCYKYLSLLIFTVLSVILDLFLNNSFLKYFEF